MAEPARASEIPLYDQDLYAWSEDQARLLKARSSAGLDWDNLAEEIRTLGRSERSEIRSRLVVALHQMLKWQYRPKKRKLGWAASILEARDQLDRVMDESPSLRTYPDIILADQYVIARLRAADETGLPLATFPENCPYRVSEILDKSFMPGEHE
jgi:hypothetical protein